MVFDPRVRRTEMKKVTIFRIFVKTIILYNSWIDLTEIFTYFSQKLRQFKSKYVGVFIDELHCKLFSRNIFLVILDTFLRKIETLLEFFAFT